MLLFKGGISQNGLVFVLQSSVLLKSRDLLGQLFLYFWERRPTRPQCFILCEICHREEMLHKFFERVSSSLDILCEL